MKKVKIIILAVIMFFSIFNIASKNKLAREDFMKERTVTKNKNAIVKQEIQIMNGVNIIEGNKSEIDVGSEEEIKNETNMRNEGKFENEVVQNSAIAEDEINKQQNKKTSIANIKTKPKTTERQRAKREC